MCHTKKQTNPKASQNKHKTLQMKQKYLNIKSYKWLYLINLDSWTGFWISNKMAPGGRFSGNESIYDVFSLHCLIKYKLMLQHCPAGACLSSWQPIFIKLYMTKIIEIINEVKNFEGWMDTSHTCNVIA